MSSVNDVQYLIKSKFVPIIFKSDDFEDIRVILILKKHVDVSL